MVKNFITEGNEIGFLGLGQCGGNICEVAEQYSYPSAAINTASDDLNNLELVRARLLVENNGGCGKDRSEGIKAVKRDYNKILTFVNKNFQSQTTIFVAFSTGGGTGSGFAPIIIDLMTKKFADKNFIALAFTPTNKEGLSSLDNNVECLRELHRLKIPTMLVDNNKFYDKNKDKSKKDFFDLINVYAISNIQAIFNPESENSSIAGNADRKDLSKLFSLPGCIMVAKKTFTEQDLANKGIEQIILNTIDSNIYADINSDNVVGRMGFIYELPERCQPNMNYDKIKEEFGTPIDIFEGFRNIEDVTNQKFRIIVIFSGLSFPKERIEEYAKLIEEDVSNTNESEDDIFDGIKKDKKLLNHKREVISGTGVVTTVDTDDPESIDLEDLFSNYE
jgi:cell division GTPase FtsZ